MRRFSTSLAICVSILLLVSIGLAQQTTTITIPNMIRYSGSLKDAQGTIASSTVGVTFAIYRQQEGGASIWMETQNVVTDAAGNYSVLLGSTTATGLPGDLFSQQEQRWLGVQAAGEAEQPRVLLVSVPYAFKAHEAETLGGMRASDFMLSKGSNATSSNGPAGQSSTQAPGNVAGNNANPRQYATSQGPTNFSGTTADQIVKVTQSGTGFGVNVSSPGNGVVGTSTTGANYGVWGQSLGAGGFGVLGTANSTSGAAIGVKGSSISPAGTGVRGIESSTTGNTAGVSGYVASAAGTAGIFNNAAGGKIIVGQNNGVQKFSVDGSGNIVSSGTISTIGLSGTTSAPTGVGLTGDATNTTGANTGVLGESASSNGVGVSGVANGATGQNIGVLGQSNSNGGWGVYGQNNSTTGQVVGVEGFVSSTGDGSAGVLGNAFGATGQTVGVNGITHSATDFSAGVAGNALATTGLTHGVNGRTSSTSTSAAGVHGAAIATTGQVYGVAGETASVTDSAAGVSGSATGATGSTDGVFGFNNSTSDNAAGVKGYEGATSGQAYGVVGQTLSAGGAGVFGINNASSGGVGVNGSATATTGNPIGVYGASTSPTGFGMLGENSSSTTGTGVQGQTESTGSGAVAGQFVAHGGGGYILRGLTGSTYTQVFAVDASGNGSYAGDLNVSGTLTKGGGSFKIDDPLDPENKYLSHSFVESPDMMNIYNGIARLDARGEAWVELPDYFEALNRDFRYQLTSIGASQPRLYIAREVKGNRFKIAGGKANAKVSWQLTGIRQDAWANAHRIPVEEEKPADKRGQYLHPDVYPAANQNTDAMLQH